ncbi:MAG: efflux RND transporter periplasmic adaptor subunit, partial [Acidiferrobacterales bacterium]
MRRAIHLRKGSVALVLLALVGCEETNTYVEPPPPKVTVARPLVEEVTDYIDFTGTTVASNRVEVRARVSGVLQSMHFTPGIDVKAGKLLFVIDPKEYQANLQAAQAELASAQAKFERADIEAGRAQRLYEQRAGSEKELVRWRGERNLARAAIQSAQARIARAELDLSYTRVKAPISGRVGRNRVDVGNLVGEGEASVLTEITSYDPMYVYFNLNERDLLRLRALYRERVKEKGVNPAKDSDVKAEIRVHLGLADQEGYPHEGVLDFAESGVDAETGTLQLRGVFANKEVPTALLPGLFARVRLPIAKRPNMPLVTERAIGADQSGRYLLVINKENTVEKRNIKLGQLVDGL